MAVKHIVHSIPPTYDERSRVLVLGSLPSPKSREVQFNYGHPQNRFWRVVARLADEPVPSTNERKRDFCLRHHIALWDVVAECDIEGASDASIRNACPNDLALITENAPVEAVFCTGAKAHDLYRKLGCEQACGLPAVKLPSTSPANAACGLDRLVEAYAAIFAHAHAFTPPVLDVARVVELEQRIASDGTPLSELMDRAGAAVAKRAGELLGEAASARTRDGEPGGARCGEPDGARDGEPGSKRDAVTIFCGSGNNGGDGWVAAELLAREGVPVQLVTSKLPAEIKAQPARDAAMRSFELLQTIEAPEGRAVADVLVNPDATRLRYALERSLVIVDAILGTGFDASTIKEPYRTWIDAVNATEGARVLAVDVPSGVSAQRGSDGTQAPSRIVADETLTMICQKPGLTSPECGTVRVAPLAYIEPYFA